MNVIKINFEQIGEAVEKSGLSTREIARKAGIISHSTVHNILRRNSNPEAINLKKVCDVIGLPIEKAFIERRAA